MQITSSKKSLLWKLDYAILNYEVVAKKSVKMVYFDDVWKEAKDVSILDKNSRKFCYDIANYVAI